MAGIPLDPSQSEAMRAMFGPHQVDQTLRQAVSMCWMSLPKERQTVDEVEAQVRRLVERILTDLREDAAAFGFGER